RLLISFLCVTFALISFFHAPPSTGIYPLSLHDALPISRREFDRVIAADPGYVDGLYNAAATAALSDRQEDAVAFLRRAAAIGERSEEHTSELQSPCNLVCRLLLEKKKKQPTRVPA